MTFSSLAGTEAGAGVHRHTKRRLLNDLWLIKELLIGLIIVPLFLIVIPLLVPIFLIMGAYFICWGTWLGLRVQREWYPKGKYMLFVYSNSPNWKDYIEENILPKIEKHAVIINWSERSQWDWKHKSLELQVFRHWAHVNKRFWQGIVSWSGEAFNPIAITFLPWWKRRIFKFWQPFKDYKHGKQKPLKDLEQELFKLLDQSAVIKTN